MRCYNHKEKEAVIACTSCGKFICEECNVEVDGKAVCKSCIQGKIGKFTINRKKWEFDFKELIKKNPRNIYILIAFSTVFISFIPFIFGGTMNFPWWIFAIFWFCDFDDKEYQEDEDETQKKSKKEDAQTIDDNFQELFTKLKSNSYEFDKKSLYFSAIGTAIDDELKQIVIKTNNIISFVEENPSQIKNLDKFINVYMDHTVKILNEYERLLQQDRDNENVLKLSEKMEDAIRNAVMTFDKNLAKNLKESATRLQKKSSNSENSYDKDYFV